MASAAPVLQAAVLRPLPIAAHPCLVIGACGGGGASPDGQQVFNQPVVRGFGQWAEPGHWGEGLGHRTDLIFIVIVVALKNGMNGKKNIYIYE